MVSRSACAIGHANGVLGMLHGSRKDAAKVQPDQRSHGLFNCSPRQTPACGRLAVVALWGKL